MFQKRYGIPTAPDGCGHPGDGACPGCIKRTVRRGKWAIRQLLPLKYSTYYGTNDLDGTGPQFVNFSTWRMWFGRVFGEQRVMFRIAEGEWERRTA